MRRFTQITKLIFLISFAMGSCRKNTTKPSRESSEYFPNKVGNYWEYEVFDSTSSKHYNVIVKITGTQKLLDGGTANVYEYQFPWGNDTNYVKQSQDTVSVYDKFRIESIYNLKFPSKVFLIPFQNEQRWDGKLIVVDSSHVKAESSIPISTEEFKNGFSIYHHYLGPNMEYNDIYYFIPKIGMIKIYYEHYDLGPPTKVLWQLKKYYLK